MLSIAAWTRAGRGCIAHTIPSAWRRLRLGTRRARREHGEMKSSIRRAPIMRCLLASLVFVVATSWSPMVWAIAVMGSVERDVDRDYEVNLVSRADCELPAQYTFHLTGVTSGASLSVWGTGTGADCLQTTSRSGADAQCFLIRDIGNITTMTTDV